jgi:hypothetical protein
MPAVRSEGGIIRATVPGATSKLTGDNVTPCARRTVTYECQRDGETFTISLADSPDVIVPVRWRCSCGSQATTAQPGAIDRPVRTQSNGGLSHAEYVRARRTTTELAELLDWATDRLHGRA